MRRREWLRCTDPERMLRDVIYPQSESIDRRSRFFVITATRRLWEGRDEAPIQRAVETAWRHADGAATAEETARSIDDLDRIYHLAGAIDDLELARLARVLGGLLRDWPGPAALELVLPLSLGGSRPLALLTADELHACCPLLREFFPGRGNDPHARRPWLAWRGGTVPLLAQAAYETGAAPAASLDPARLGLLSDALLDAGCHDAALLQHVRSPGPHYRGCWAVDVLLGKP